MTAETSARYFFLSYPRLPPLPPVPGVPIADPPDEWVRAFYDDLTEAVRVRARTPPLRPGFLDVGALPEAEWTATLIDTLRTDVAFSAGAALPFG